MENDTTKGGFWMLVEEIGQEPRPDENRRADKKEILEDEFFPDTSF